jgi:hypothetical protein
MNKAAAATTPAWALAAAVVAVPVMLVLARASK